MPHHDGCHCQPQLRRKVGQKMAENRVKLGLAGAVLLVVVGDWRPWPPAPGFVRCCV
jgi:hypothetical protein